jgi:predicted SAM-dependent methyltransferase
MKIQLSHKRVVKDAMTVWYEHGPEVDLVMDIKNLTFAPGSVSCLYAFHVLEHFMPKDVVTALASWKRVLAPGSKMYLVNDDFEVIARSFVGGDISIEQFNDGFTHPTYVTRDNIVTFLAAIDVPSDKIVMWFADVTNEFPKAEHELVVSATV